MEIDTMIPTVAAPRLRTDWPALLGSGSPVANVVSGTSVAADFPTATADHATAPSKYTRDRMVRFATKQASPPRGVPR